MYTGHTQAIQKRGDQTIALKHEIQTELKH